MCFKEHNSHVWELMSWCLSGSCKPQLTVASPLLIGLFLSTQSLSDGILSFFMGGKSGRRRRRGKRRRKESKEEEGEEQGEERRGRGMEKMEEWGGTGGRKMESCLCRGKGVSLLPLKCPSSGSPATTDLQESVLGHFENPTWTRQHQKIDVGSHH